MALTHCPECKKEISSSARSCPHCGYTPKKSGGGCLTYILWIIAFFIAFYLISLIIGNSSTGSSVIDDTRTYEQSWRSPSNEELVSISKLMIKNNISGCGEYHIKEIENNEFVIACSADGKNWTYYVAWPNIDEINLANDEMERKLKPPY
jgi:hypothetical protein